MRHSLRLPVIAVVAVLGLLVIGEAAAQSSIQCWFPPSWKSKGLQARKITRTLSTESGLKITPRIAESYPEVLNAFTKQDQCLVYVGSFVQTIINERGLGRPLAQAVTGKEMYSGVLVHPKGTDPAAIIAQHGAEIAFARGASSGESSAEAATGGKANVPVANHGAAVQAVLDGKAKAAVVKNWWWDANKTKYADMVVYVIPGISITKNPDNVLTASKGISQADADKIAAAALKSAKAFKADSMKPFDTTSLTFSAELMKKGKIDPQSYDWK